MHCGCAGGSRAAEGWLGSLNSLTICNRAGRSLDQTKRHVSRRAGSLKISVLRNASDMYLTYCDAAVTTMLLTKYSMLNETTHRVSLQVTSIAGTAALRLPVAGLIIVLLWSSLSRGKKITRRNPLDFSMDQSSVVGGHHDSHLIMSSWHFLRHIGLIPHDAAAMMLVIVWL